jgi:hypothetical protein
MVVRKANRNKNFGVTLLRLSYLAMTVPIIVPAVIFLANMVPAIVVPAFMVPCYVFTRCGARCHGARRF